MPIAKGRLKNRIKLFRITVGAKTTANKQQRSVTDKEAKSKTSNNWREWIRDIALTMSALTGILLAFLVFFGRIYADAYFGALNIPGDQVNFPIVDYAAVGWEPPLFVIFFVSVTLIYFGIFLLPYELFLARDILKIIKWVKNRFVSREKLEQPLPFISTRLLLLGLAGLVLAIVPFVALPYLSKNISEVRSQTAAREQLNRSMKMDILSEKPLWSDLTPASCTATFSGSCLMYQDLYLLTYNNGHYFLFREVGSDCKPKQVYVVKDENLLGIKMNADIHPPIPPECKKSSVSATPSSMPTSTQSGPASSTTATQP